MFQKPAGAKLQNVSSKWRTNPGQTGRQITMTENIIPVITDVGEISGRDAIFLDKVNVINESTFELTGEFNAALCSNLQNDDRKYSLTFKGVHLFKMTELDFCEIEYHSSFDLVENSDQVSKMVHADKTNHIGKIDPSYKHYIFTTYDTVFEVVCKEFALKLL
jgi:hypothetical protein